MSLALRFSVLITVFLGCNSKLNKLAIPEPKDYTIPLSVQELEDAFNNGNKVVLTAIYFTTASVELMEKDSEKALQNIATFLANHPKQNYLIAVHSDKTGDETVNLNLSELRANAISDFIITNFEIQEEQLTFRGMGSSKPIASNDTPEGRRKNRRIELIKK